VCSATSNNWSWYTGRGWALFGLGKLLNRTGVLLYPAANLLLVLNLRLHNWLTYSPARLKGQICHDCRLRSVVSPWSAHCPFRGHISKTEQDRPTVTMGHYLAVGIADSIAALRSSADLPEEIFWLQVKTCSTINMAGILKTWQHLWHDAKVEHEVGQLLIYNFIHHHVVAKKIT